MTEILDVNVFVTRGGEYLWLEEAKEVPAVRALLVGRAAVATPLQVRHFSHLMRDFSHLIRGFSHFIRDFSYLMFVFRDLRRRS